MKQRFLLSCGLILTFMGGIAPRSAHAQTDQTDQNRPATPKIVILPARVTLDGVAQPDLGQSLSDIISARLLTASSVEVLDADSPLPDSALPLPAAIPPSAFPGGTMVPSTLPAPSLSLPASGAPIPAGATPIGTGLAMGANFVVQPTIVGHGNEFRLTLRQIQIPSGKVIAIITEKTATGLKGLYALAENHALRLVPPLPPVPRAKNAGPAIIDHPAHYQIPTPVPPPVSAEEIAQAPKALEKLSPAKQAAINATLRLLDPAASAAGPTPIGRIGELDAQWTFCVITLKPPLELPAGTSLFACAGGNPESVVNLSVTRMDGRKVIADFAPGPVAATLRAGDLVYHWKPTPAPVP